jgi:hypothetical protein
MTTIHSIGNRIGESLMICMAICSVSAGAEPRPNDFKGLILGESTRGDSEKVLGTPSEGMRRGGSDWYPAKGMAGATDRLYFSGGPGKLMLVTAASADPRYATQSKILSALGPPEARVLFQTQAFLDYSERGLRFICDAEGKTIGSIHFRAGRRRVPAGYPNTSDLRRDTATHPPAEPPTDFRIGAAEITINPTTFHDIAFDSGQNKYSLHEDLYARVAIFQRGSEKVVFIGADVFGMATWDIDALRTSLAEKGFSNVVVAMSHTHANIDTIGFYGYYPKTYAKHIVRQMEKAVMQAADEMAPIRMLLIGSVEMPLTGGRVVDLVRNGRNPGIVDPTVSLVQAIGLDGRPILNLINLACHPEVIPLKVKRELSPDFVGTLCNEVRRELGGQPVFLNGALGGMLTPDAPIHGYESAVAMGQGFAKFVIDAAKSASPAGSYDLGFHRRPVEYPITAEAILKYMENLPEPMDFVDGRVRSELNAVWIGDAQFITVPGELLPEIGFEIMAAMKGRVRGIVGLANAELGYLVPSYDFRKDAYEERTGPGAAGGEITRSVGLELAPLLPTNAQ